MIIGVHTPEFLWEKSKDRVEAKTRELRIRYAVALDNDYQNWKRYGNRYWPTQYLIDRRGVLRQFFIGDGSDSEVEAALRALLAEPART